MRLPNSLAPLLSYSLTLLTLPTSRPPVLPQCHAEQPVNLFVQRVVGGKLAQVDRVKVVKRFDEVPRIRAYPLELSQVFVTLLTNAAEAIDETGTITLSTVADGSDVFVTVADSGRGIPSEELETLFDIGFVKKGPRVRMRLGLANAYNIIKKHGGELDVLSAVGRGTEFTLKLPIN